MDKIRPNKSPSGGRDGDAPNDVDNVTLHSTEEMLPDPYTARLEFTFRGDLFGKRSALGVFLEPVTSIKSDEPAQYRTSLIAVKRGGSGEGMKRWVGFSQSAEGGAFIGHLKEVTSLADTKDDENLISLHINMRSQDDFALELRLGKDVIGSAQGQRQVTLFTDESSPYLSQNDYLWEEVTDNESEQRKFRFMVIPEGVSCDGVDYTIGEEEILYGLRKSGTAKGLPMATASLSVAKTGFQTAIIIGPAKWAISQFAYVDVMPWPWTDIGKCGPIEPGGTVMTPESVEKYREWRALKRKWKRFILDVVPAVQAINCKNFYICPSLVLAILWDEMARGSCSTSAWIKDIVQEDIGGDPTCGPLQIRLSLARDLIQHFGIQTHHNVDSDDDLQDALTYDMGFAATLAAYNICKIWNEWKSAGHDPCTPGGLGPNKLSPFVLIGTLYSLEYIPPKPNPRSNKRGRQIAKWASQIVADCGFQPCDPCNPAGVIRHPGPIPELFWNALDWGDLSTAEQREWGKLGWDAANWTDPTLSPDSASTPWDDLSDAQRDAAGKLGYSESSWNGS